MIQRAILLIVSFLLGGLTYSYWEGQPFWSVPWFPIFCDVFLLFELIKSWKAESNLTQTNRKIALLAIFVRWTAWIFLTGYLFLSAGYFFLWRACILKYACMQEFTPAMHAHMRLVFHPLTGLAVDIAFGLVALNIVLMIMSMIFRQRLGSKIRWLIGSKPYIGFAILAITVCIGARHLPALLTYIVPH